MDTSYVGGQSVGYGEFKPAILSGNGPLAYPATGDIINNPATGDYISFPMDCTTLSGLYQLSARPASAGALAADIRAGAPSPSQSGWTWVWRFASGLPAGTSFATLNAFTAGTGYTNGVYQITAAGTTSGTAPIVQVTVAGGVVTAASVVDPGLYISGATPTVPLTALGGGTGGAVTLTSNVVTPNITVPTNSNLSAEVAQFGAIVSQL
jgi:hypothetical protein